MAPSKYSCSSGGSLVEHVRSVYLAKKGEFGTPVAILAGKDP